MTRISALVLSALAGLAAFSSAGAQPAQDFYKGEQITMLVSTAAGGGYDTYARTLARHMTKHIPGAPTIVRRRPYLDATLKDPAFLSDAARLQMEVDPLDGPAIEALLAKAYNAPRDVVAAAAQLVP